MSGLRQRFSSLRGHLVGGALLTLALLAVGLAQTAPGRSALRGLDLAAPAEPVIVLAFADPAALTALTTATPARPPSAITVPFRLANLSGPRRTLVWRVSVDGVTRATGSVSVASGATVTRSVSLTRVCAQRGRPAAARVDVALRNPRRGIDLLVRCRA